MHQITVVISAKPVNPAPRIRLLQNIESETLGENEPGQAMIPDKVRFPALALGSNNNNPRKLQCRISKRDMILTHNIPKVLRNILMSVVTRTKYLHSTHISGDVISHVCAAYVCSV